MTLQFPTMLPLPAEVAASLRLQCLRNVPVNCTAQDLAWLFVALEAAARVEKSEGGYWLLNDNNLRAVLDQPSRQRAEVEAARWDRLGALILEIGDRSYLAPTVGARAVTRDGEAHWSIDDRLVERWRTYEQTTTVRMPLRILQKATRRTTILLALRILAWRAGLRPAGSVLSGDSNSLSLRLMEQEVRDEFGLNCISKQKVGEHLTQAAAELASVGAPMSAQVSPVVALRYAQPVTVRRRGAPIVAFDIRMSWNNAALATPASAPFGGRGWRRKRSTAHEPKRLPLLDHVDNVLPFPDDDIGFVDLGALRVPDRS